MSTSAEILLFDGEFESSFDPDRPILMEPGQYEVAFVRHWKGYMYGKIPKLIMVFRVMTEGSYYGQHLYRCYGIKGYTKRKEIIPKGWHSHLVRDYSKLFGRPRKLRDIGTCKFKNKILSCSVRTVERDSKQTPLPDELKYSVIDEFIKVIAG